MTYHSSRPLQKGDAFLIAALVYHHRGQQPSDIAKLLQDDVADLEAVEPHELADVLAGGFRFSHGEITHAIEARTDPLNYMLRVRVRSLIQANSVVPCRTETGTVRPDHVVPCLPGDEHDTTDIVPCRTDLTSVRPDNVVPTPSTVRHGTTIDPEDRTVSYRGGSVPN